MQCFVLHYIVIHYHLLPCIALPCTEMQCTTIHCTVLQCNVMYCTALHYTYDTCSLRLADLHFTCQCLVWHMAVQFTLLSTILCILLNTLYTIQYALQSTLLSSPHCKLNTIQDILHFSQNLKYALQ